MEAACGSGPSDRCWKPAGWQPGRGRGRGSSLALPASERLLSTFHLLLGARGVFEASVGMAGGFWDAALPGIFIVLILVVAALGAFRFTVTRSASKISGVQTV